MIPWQCDQQNPWTTQKKRTCYLQQIAEGEKEKEKSIDLKRHKKYIS